MQIPGILMCRNAHYISIGLATIGVCVFCAFTSVGALFILWRNVKMYCGKCGKPIDDNSKFCSACGNQMYQEVKNDEQSKMITEKPKVKSNLALKIAVIIMSVIILIMGVFLSTNIISNNSSTTNNANIQDENVETAITALKQHWIKTFAEYDRDGYLEITHTRVVEIDYNKNKEFAEMFESWGKIEYIVEFDLYTDYYGTAPYYQNIKYDDTVVIYKNGSAEVKTNPLKLYSTKTYSYDYSKIIVGIEDYDISFNQVFDLG